MRLAAEKASCDVQTRTGWFNQDLVSGLPSCFAGKEASGTVFA